MLIIFENTKNVWTEIISYQYIVFVHSVHYCTLIYDNIHIQDDIFRIQQNIIAFDFSVRK